MARALFAVFVLALLVPLAGGAAARASDMESWPAPEPAPRDGVPIAEVGIGLEGLAVVHRRFDATEGAPVVTVGLARDRECPDGAAVLPEVAVQVYVETDATAARKALRTFLEGCQRPLERLPSKDAPGDVAFGLDGTAIAFARANVAAVVRWTGRGPATVPLAPIAAALDAQIRASPLVGAARPFTAPRVLRFAPRAGGGAGTGAGGPGRSPVALALDVDGEVTARAFRSDRGTVQIDPRLGLVHVPAAGAGAGPARIEVLLLGPRGIRARAVTSVEPPR